MSERSVVERRTGTKIHARFTTRTTDCLEKKMFLFLGKQTAEYRACHP